MGSDGMRTQFVCPACEEAVPISPGIRDALLRHGCVMCGNAVTADAFSA